MEIISEGFLKFWLGVNIALNIGILLSIPFCKFIEWASK